MERGDELFLFFHLFICQMGRPKWPTFFCFDSFLLRDELGPLKFLKRFQKPSSVPSQAILLCGRCYSEKRTCEPSSSLQCC